MTLLRVTYPLLEMLLHLKLITFNIWSSGLPASIPESQLRNKVFDVIKGLDQVGVFLPITSD